MILPAGWQYAATLAAGLAVGWVAQGWRLGEQLAETGRQAEHERAEAFRYVATEQNKAAQAMAAADIAAQGELSDERKQVDALERCIAAGRGCGLRVKARCPAAGTVPTDRAAAGVGAGPESTAELDPAVGPDYRALRLGIVELEQAVKLCVSQWPAAQ